MRILSYRNKRRIKKLAIFLAVLLALLAALCVIRFIYLQRYLVYDKNQVSLDFDQNLGREPGADVPDWAQGPVEIIEEAPLVQETSPADAPMQSLRGVYITSDMLQNMDQVKTSLQKLEGPQAIMMDLKNIYGSFYYSSGTYGAVTASAADIPAINELIDRLAAEKDLYLIARITSLSDNNFALANQSTGLPLRSGALWMDSHGCYWLDPMAVSVQEYLASIAEELSALGFDEIVFDQFQIPASQNIIYKSKFTREEAAGEASEALREMLADLPIRISFNSTSPMVAANSDRVFLVTDEGSAVEELVAGVQDDLENPNAQIVFLTASRDTRFDAYGVLRPLIEDRPE